MMSLGPALRVTSGEAATDPYIANVVLLLHMAGADGATTFTDSSPAAKTITRAGAAQVSTTDALFGGSSLLLDGSGDYLQTTTTLSSFAFGTGDFTVECWMNTTDAGPGVLLDFYETANTGCWQLYLDAPAFYGENTLSWWSTNGGSGVKIIGTDFNPRDGEWHHIAVCRVSGVTRLFADGVVAGAVADTRDYTGSGISPMAVGAQVNTRNAAYDFAGRIDEVRITKGVGRYTTTFQRPTEPFPDS